MIIRSRYLLAALLLVTPLCDAQSSDKSSTSQVSQAQPTAEEPFLITLTLKTSDHGKLTTDQSYTLSVTTDHGAGLSPLTRAGSGNVREGNRIPIVTGSEGGKSQVQYVDAGTNIDLSNVKRMNSLVALNVKVEVSGVVPETAGKDDPILRQRVYSINPVLPVGKQVIVYSSTDATTGQKVEIQVLVQPI